MLMPKNVGSIIAPRLRHPIQNIGNAPASSSVGYQFSAPRPRGSRDVEPLLGRVNDYQHRRMRPAVTVEHFAADAGMLFDC